MSAILPPKFIFLLKNVGFSIVIIRMSTLPFAHLISIVYALVFNYSIKYWT